MAPEIEPNNEQNRIIEEYLTDQVKAGRAKRVGSGHEYGYVVDGEPILFLCKSGEPHRSGPYNFPTFKTVISLSESLLEELKSEAGYIPLEGQVIRRNNKPKRIGTRSKSS